MGNESTFSYRYYNQYLNSLTINYNYLINPWVPTMWSFAFPGFGHIMTGAFVEGFILMGWEILVNTKSHLNEAIMYSFTGQFQQGKEILHLNWAILYIPMYIYIAWDAYHTTVNTNKTYVLSEKVNRPITPYKLTASSINYLERVSPPVTAIWSLFLPGLGHMLTHRLPTGIFLLIFWVAICIGSGLPDALIYILTGSFQEALSALKTQWFLYLPSLYGFSYYDAYISCVESNKVFKLQQAQYLKREYQSNEFIIPW